MVLTLIVSYSNIFLSIFTKSDFMYNIAFFMFFCGILQMLTCETRFRSIGYAAVAVCLSLGAVYAAICNINYGAYCADYSIVAVQFVLLSIYTLLSIRKKKQPQEE